MLLIILSDVPPGSVLGPISFNVVLSDLFFCLTKSQLNNFADDSFITANCDHLVDLLN